MNNGKNVGKWCGQVFLGVILLGLLCWILYHFGKDLGEVFYYLFFD